MLWSELLRRKNRKQVRLRECGEKSKMNADEKSKAQATTIANNRFFNQVQNADAHSL